MNLFRSMLFAGALFCVSGSWMFSASAADVSSWPQWRGASQNGVAPDGNFPAEWAETSNVVWKTSLPGRGGSTPVLADGKAFMTAGVKGKNHVLAVDLDSGSIAWQTPVGSDAGGKHRKGSGSNPSASTDGKHVYAYFRSGDLACLSLSGEIVWKKNLQEQFGEDTLWWDLGTSPMLTETAIVVAVMQTGPSYLVAFDKLTGKEIWKTDRNLQAPEEAAQSYATPLNVSINGKPGIAVMGADHLTLHDGAGGKEIARLGGFNPGGEKYFRSIASPVAEGGLVICPYARGETLTCVNIDALAAGKGKEAIEWFRDDLGSDVPTPAALDGKLYVVSDFKTRRGKIACLDLTSGETLWDLQLPKSRDGFSSSPLIAGNHLYVTAENAVTYVIGPLSAQQPQLVSTNRVADSEPFTVASPVPVEGSLLIRTRNALYRVGK